VGFSDFLPTYDERLLRWFGASRVAEPDGSPRVVYHGTAHAPGEPRFTTFLGPRSPFRYPATPGGRFVGVGTFFSESPLVAVSYPRFLREGDTRVTYRVHLRIENPKGYTTARAAADDMVGRVGNDPEAFVRVLRSEGYDGLTFLEGPSYAPRDREKKARVWVPFSVDQIWRLDGSMNQRRVRSRRS
jgi:hypothetical protein